MARASLAIRPPPVSWSVRRLLLLATGALAAAWSPPSSPLSPPTPAEAAAATRYVVADEAVQALEPLLRASLEANRKEFRGRTGTVRGFGAGTLYPQVWLRDSATLIPLSRWLYSREYLTSWIEEH